MIEDIYLGNQQNLTKSRSIPPNKGVTNKSLAYNGVKTEQSKNEAQNIKIQKI